MKILNVTHQFSFKNVNYESFKILIETVTRSSGSNLSDSKFNFKYIIHVHFDPFFIHFKNLLFESWVILKCLQISAY